MQLQVIEKFRKSTTTHVERMSRVLMFRGDMCSVVGKRIKRAIDSHYLRCG